MNTRERQDAVSFLMRHVRRALDESHPLRKAFEAARKTGCSGPAAAAAYGLWTATPAKRRREILNGWEWPKMRLHKCGPRSLMPALVYSQERNGERLESAVIRYAMIDASRDVTISIPAGTTKDEAILALMNAAQTLGELWEDLPGKPGVERDAVQFTAAAPNEKSGTPQRPEAVTRGSNDSDEARPVAAA